VLGGCHELPLAQVAPSTRAADISGCKDHQTGGREDAGLTCGSIFKRVSSALVVVSLASLPFAISWSFAAAAALGRDRYEAYAGFELSYSVVLVVVGLDAEWRQLGRAAPGRRSAWMATVTASVRNLKALAIHR